MNRKSFFQGTHRAISPAQTLARIEPCVAALGITRVANITGLDTIGIPVVMACRPNSLSLAVTQGKGLTLESAKASALMEAVECYHAERITAPLRMASYEELSRSASVVDVNKLPLLKGSPFHPGLRILWVEGRDWSTGQPVWIPYRSVHTIYTAGSRAEDPCFFSSTNGLASGNVFLEALSHGICEVVERDSSALLALAPDKEHISRQLNLDTVNDRECRMLLDLFHQARVAVIVWETTSEIGIPSFDCVIIDRQFDPSFGMGGAGGSGCHPCRAIALSRALTEAAQSRLTNIAGSRDDCVRSQYLNWLDPDLTTATRRMVCADQGTRSFELAPTFESDTFEEDVRFELERLNSAGFHDVLYVELTNPADSYSVARVLIPGLEPVEGPIVPGPRARQRMEKLT